jgi:preprotein translocase subunit SecF
MLKKIPHINFIDTKHYAFLCSFLLSIFSIILLAVNGLNFSIDFKGGTIIDFQTTHQNVVAELQDSLNEKNYKDFEINKIVASELTYSLKMGTNTSEDIEKLVYNLKQKFDDIKLDKIDYIGPKIGAEFASDAAKAIVFSLIAMMIYVWIRFDLIFSFGVIVALLHDVLITLGFFSLTQFQFDLTSIAVILTIVGYSINDSIVIYDRIRENITNKINTIKRIQFCDLINRSINETLSRTIMTSLTTLVVCIALLILGGEALRGFSAGLSFGIAFGTYSSIYVSAPILIFFSKR